jgi:hypothetical protein
MSGEKMNQRIALLLPCFAAILCHGLISADEPAKLEWKYSVDLLRSFWQGTVIHGESVLFIRDEATGEGRASVLIPILEA